MLCSFYFNLFVIFQRFIMKSFHFRFWIFKIILFYLLTCSILPVTGTSMYRNWYGCASHPSYNDFQSLLRHLFFEVPVAWICTYVFIYIANFTLTQFYRDLICALLKFVTCSSTNKISNIPNCNFDSQRNFLEI